MRLFKVPRYLSALLVVGVLAACSATDNAEPPTPLTSFPATARVVSVWTSRISGEANSFAYTLVPYVQGEAVYVVDDKGTVLALSQESGETLWKQSLDLNVSAGISGDGNNLYFGTLQGELVALNQADGSELWRNQMTTEIVAPPTAGDGVVVARSINGRVSLFSADDGDEQWTYNHNVPALTIRGNSPAFLMSNGVLVGLDNGRLLALDLERGQPFWQVTLSEPSGRSEIERLSDIDASIQTDNEFIYAAGFQGKLAQISPDKGRIIWAREVSTIAGFRVTGDAIYVSDTDSNVWSIDRNTGAALWKQEKLRARQLTAPVPIGEYVVVGDLEGYVHWLSRIDGSLAARKRIDSSRIVTAAAVAEGTLFVQTGNGAIAALQIIPEE